MLRPQSQGRRGPSERLNGSPLLSVRDARDSCPKGHATLRADTHTREMAVDKHLTEDGKSVALGAMGPLL